MEIRNTCNDIPSSELLIRLEKANEDLMDLKNNREISKKILQKLKLENFALSEENKELKRRINNAEKNASFLTSKLMGSEESSFLSNPEQNFEASFRKTVNTYSRAGTSSTSIKNIKKNTPIRTLRNNRSVNPCMPPVPLAQRAMLRAALIYNL